MMLGTRGSSGLLKRALPRCPCAILLATGYAEIPAGSQWPRIPKPFAPNALARAIAE